MESKAANMLVVQTPLARLRAKQEAVNETRRQLNECKDRIIGLNLAVRSNCDSASRLSRMRNIYAQKDSQELQDSAVSGHETIAQLRAKSEQLAAELKNGEDSVAELLASEPALLEPSHEAFERRSAANLSHIGREIVEYREYIEYEEHASLGCRGGYYGNQDAEECWARSDRYAGKKKEFEAERDALEKHSASVKTDSERVELLRPTAALHRGLANTLPIGSAARVRLEESATRCEKEISAIAARFGEMGIPLVTDLQAEVHSISPDIASIFQNPMQLAALICNPGSGLIQSSV